MSIGHEEDEGDALLIRRKMDQSLLWANQHGDEEFLLLLEYGHDVMSADGVLNIALLMSTGICLGYRIPKKYWSRSFIRC